MCNCVVQTFFLVSASGCQLPHRLFLSADETHVPQAFTFACASEMWYPQKVAFTSADEVHVRQLLMLASANETRYSQTIIFTDADEIRVPQAFFFCKRKWNAVFPSTYLYERR